MRKAKLPVLKHGFCGLIVPSIRHMGKEARVAVASFPPAPSFASLLFRKACPHASVTLDRVG